MNKTRFSRWILIGLLSVLTACQAAGQPLGATISQPGDAGNGVRLATGAADAPPLWAFCSAGPDNAHTRTFDCRAPAWQTLAVGHLFLLADAALSNGQGADLTWELWIDDYAVDLDSFGTFDQVVPSMPTSPSPIREVFMRVTDWNLVMTNLNPGNYTLAFRAQSETESYLWLVRLVIEGTQETDISAAPFPLHS